MGQNDGVKKLRQLRKEIAQIKTVARERELGIHGESQETKPAAEAKVVKAEEPVAVAAAKAAKKAAPKTAAAAKTKTAQAKETRK